MMMYIENGKNTDKLKEYRQQLRDLTVPYKEALAKTGRIAPSKVDQARAIKWNLHDNKIPDFNQDS